MGSEVERSSLESVAFVKFIALVSIGSKIQVDAVRPYSPTVADSWLVGCDTSRIQL